MKKGDTFQPYFTIKGVALEDYKKGRFNEMRVNYHYYDTQFGKVLVITNPFGVMCVAFCDEKENGETFARSSAIVSTAECYDQEDELQHRVIDFLSGKKSSEKIVLYLAGTDFQMRVWEELLKIPVGSLKTYKEVATALNIEKGVRAVGSAIGRNPIAFLIPCHRVIRSDGGLGGYRWGLERKKRIIDWEQSL